MWRFNAAAVNAFVMVPGRSGRALKVSYLSDDDQFRFIRALSELNADETRKFLTRYPELCHATISVDGQKPLPILRYVIQCVEKKARWKWDEDSDSVYCITKAFLQAGAKLEDNTGASRTVNHIPGKRGKSLLEIAACTGIAPMVRAILEHAPKAALEQDPVTAGTPLQHVVDTISDARTAYAEHPHLFKTLNLLAECSALNGLEPFVNSKGDLDGRYMLPTLYAQLHEGYLKPYYPRREAFSALTNAGMDVDILINDQRTFLQMELAHSHSLESVQSTNPHRETALQDNIEDLTLLLLCGSNQDLECMNTGLSCREWMERQQDVHPAHIAYRAAHKKLAQECSDILTQKKDIGKLLIRERPGFPPHLTNLARALAEFDMLHMLFTEPCMNAHGGNAQMAQNAQCIEALLPDRLKHRTHITRALREHSLSVPDNTALAQYVRGDKQEMSVA